MKDKLEHRWEEIGPDKAMKYLETMNGNRTVRQARVDFYAAQMKAGMWRPTHQGIAFDKDGHLVDGQHRMWAAVESKTAITIMVSRGLSPEDVEALDTVLTRNYSDVAYYQGWEPTDPMTGAVAKMLVLGPTGSRNRVIPAPVMHEWYEFYKEGIDFALHLRWNCAPSAGKVLTLPITAAFARAYYSVNKDVLARMGEVVKTGQYGVEADRAAFVLREAWLLKRMGATQGEPYFKTEAAIRAFVERRPIKKLQVTEGEIFDIPKLPKEKRYEPTATHSDTKKYARRLAKAKEAV